MLVSFLIMLREGIEAALIVGIIASFLRHTGRSGLLPAVWAGVFFALGLSLLAGAGLQWMAADFPQKQQELFEGVVGLIAVAMLTSMALWMKKAAGSIKGRLQASVDAALLSTGDANGVGRGSWALIGMVFLAVAREGLESVFFLLAIFQQSQGASTAVGALAGIALSVLLGVAIYKGAVRLDLRRFFRWTGVLILLVAAGLLAGAVRRFHEAGVWNLWQGVVFDSSAVLPEDSPLGVLLGGLLGYMHAPVVSEVLAWGMYLLITLVLFLRPNHQPPAVTPTTATASAAPTTSAVPTAPPDDSQATAARAPALGAVVLGSGLVLLLGMAAFWQAASSTAQRAGAGGGSGPDAVSTVTVDGEAGIPVIHIAVNQGTCEPHAVTVPAGRVQFRITNGGQRALEWEILDGVMVLEERENILPGMTQVLTTRLSPGQYAMTCGTLNAPRGSLTVVTTDAFKAAAAKPAATAFIGALAEYQVYTLTEVAQLQDMLQALSQRIDRLPALSAGTTYSPTMTVTDQAAQTAQAASGPGIPDTAADSTIDDGYPADPLELLGMARGQYQKLAPLAVSMAEHARIDARANDFVLRDKDPQFVGLQRLAQGLKTGEGRDALQALLAALQQDVAQLAERLAAVDWQPALIASASAKALERASTLIPGDAVTAEQGRAVLQFVYGTVAAADKAQQLLAPVLSPANPMVAQQLQSSIDKLHQWLGEQGVSAGTVGIAGTANTAGDGLRITGVQLNPVQCQNLALALYQASQAMGKVNAALGLN